MDARKDRHEAPRRRLTGEQRKQTLLDAAAEIAMEAGLDHVTMERAAEWVGVHKKVAYRYFPNRDALLVALFERENTLFDYEVAVALEGCQSFEDQVRAVVRTYLSALDGGRLHVHNTAASGLSGPIVEYQAERTAGVIDYFVELMQSHGSLPPEVARTGAIVFIYGLDGLLLQRASTGADREALVETYVAMALASLDRLQRRAGARRAPERGGRSPKGAFVQGRPPR